MLGEREAERAALDKVAGTRFALPALAAHLSDAALRAAPSETKRQLTLQKPVQSGLEAVARQAAQKLGARVSVAMVLADARTGDILGSVGSADYFDPSRFGWIDMTKASRSPGSTLKPFIYGMAFDDGVASPDTTIADAPRRFASYRPDNFDRTFRGDVTVAQALQHSLNVPAVSALDAIGARRFAAALAFAGADLSMPLTSDEETGLAIALGGAGLTVRDLALLYAALGDDGRALPLHWLKSETESAALAKSPATQIMSAESAREIMRILSAAPTPEGRMPAMLTQEAPVIAFKTGTSYGYRDAWAAGVGNGFVVVIWIGRADGAPRAGVTGREGALPILFDTFDAISRITPVRPSGPPLREADSPDHAPPAPLARFERENAPPHILFPPHGAEVWSDSEHKSFVLAAEGHGRLAWYVDGKPLSRNVAGDTVWRPAEAGFYNLSVVDPAGRTARSRVRVKTPEG
jgi:penicillin-binding protein 1C